VKKKFALVAAYIIIGVPPLRFWPPPKFGEGTSTTSGVVLCVCCVCSSEYRRHRHRSAKGSTM